MIKYTKQHEWVAINDGDEKAAVGITDYAQKQLGDIVYVELPGIGVTVNKGDEAAVVESVKAAAEVYSPISGEILEVNENLADSPELINNEAEAQGWFFKLVPSEESELEELMDKEGYHKYIGGLD
ncbi:MAG: glycine cleavage system protein H [Rhodospirillaceae bacterium]|nr:glycine cleavage system protein H [Rhodospirillaceae bacterium]